jgi:hypothetical protein
MPGTLPFNFGEYSPRTLGITINLPLELGERLKDIFLYLCADNATDQLQGFRKLFRQVSSDEERFLILGYASAVYHELRHFHDYLLSPIGVMDGIDFVMAVINLLPAMLILKQEEKLVIPLQAWEALSDRLYSILNRVGKGTLRRTPPDLTKGYTQAVGARFQALRARQDLFVESLVGPLTTAHIIEGSALAVQATYLILNYGAESWPVFRDGLNHIDGTGNYTRIWRLWDVALHWLPAGAQLSYGVLNSILFMSLCGIPDEEERDGLRDDPPSRLLSILGYLDTRREIPTDDTVLPLLEDWARDAGALSMTEALDIAMRSHRDYLTGAFAEMSSLEQTLGAPIYSGTRELLEAWMASREYMAAEFLRDPLTYLDPVRYLRNRDRFVACPIYLSTTSGLFERDGDLMALMRDTGWSPVYGRRSANGGRSVHQLLRAPKLTTGRTFLTRQQSWDLSSTIWLSHVLWSRDMTRSLERELAVLGLKSHLPNSTILTL